MSVNDDFGPGPDGKLQKDFFVHLAELSPLVSAVAAEFIGATDGLDPSVVERTMNSLSLAADEKQATFARDVPTWHPLFWELHVGRKHGTFRCLPAPAGVTQFQVMSPLAFLLAVYDQKPADGDKVTVRIVLNGGETVHTYIWPDQLSTLAALNEAVTTDLDHLLAHPNSDQAVRVRNLGRFGKVAHSTESGPPKWVFPRVRARIRGRGVSIMAGWWLTAHTFSWLTPDWMRS